MIGVPLILLAMLAADAQDAAGLVSQLGAPKYADREAAAQALEVLGREALPALKAAQEATDPEVRSRAALLQGKIENALMVRPTLVRLDFEDRPLPEVVKTLGDRAGMTMVLVPENNPAHQSRRITLKADEPVTLWQAVDRLSRAAKLRSHVVILANGAARAPAFQFVDRQEETDPIPTSDNGPFRLLVQGIHYHRDLTFGKGVTNPIIVGPNAQLARARPLNDEASTEQFYLDLQVTAEPRMLVAQNGPLKIVEAIDDKDQSLLPPASDQPNARVSGYYGTYSTGLASFQLQVHLKHPLQAGKTIKRFRGTLPVVVSTRKDNPLVINLADAEGKTFNSPDWSLTIHEIKADPDQPRTTIEISARSNSPADPSLGGRPAMELAGLRSSHSAQSQIEILDAQGRIYQQWFPSTSRIDANELRMTLMLLPSDDVGAPAQLRFYDMARAMTDATFEFHDVPMP